MAWVNMRRLLFLGPWLLCLASCLLLSCSGTVAGADHEPPLDAGRDGTDGVDGADGIDGGDDPDAGDDGFVEDAGDGSDAGDANDAGDEDPGPERCPPMDGTPPAQACLAAGWTGFGAGNLLVLDAPSMASQGTDFVVELSPAGAVVQAVVPPGENILGARDVVLDPQSGHLLYSVSDWTGQVFEIREVDADGNLLDTHAMPEGLDGGDIAMAFDPRGTLFVAYSSAIYKMPAGGALTWWLDIPPDQGLGEIDLDRWGNIYLTDPFVTDSVIRIGPDGAICTLVGPEEGLRSPYGLTVLPDDVIYVSGFDPDTQACQIHKIDADGTVSLLAAAVAAPGGVIRGLDTDAAGQLYATVEGPLPALMRINADGSHETVAGEAQGLVRPARVVSVSTPYPCE